MPMWLHEQNCYGRKNSGYVLDSRNVPKLLSELKNYPRMYLKKNSMASVRKRTIPTERP
jgi:hypothetical protein